MFNDECLDTMKDYRAVMAFTIFYFLINFIFDIIPCFVLMGFTDELYEGKSECGWVLRMCLQLVLATINWHPIGIYFLGLFAPHQEGELFIYHIMGGFKRIGHAFISLTMIPVITSSLIYTNHNPCGILTLTYSQVSYIAYWSCIGILVAPLIMTILLGVVYFIWN